MATRRRRRERRRLRRSRWQRQQRTARRNPVWEEGELEDIELARRRDIPRDEDLIRAEAAALGEDAGIGVSWESEPPSRGGYRKGSWEEIHAKAKAAIRRHGAFLRAVGYRHLVPELAAETVQLAQMRSLESDTPKVLTKLKGDHVDSLLDAAAAEIVAEQRKFRQREMFPSEPVLAEGAHEPEQWKRLLKDQECGEVFPLLLQEDPMAYYLWAMYNGICHQEDVPPDGGGASYDGYSIAQLAEMTGETKPGIRRILDRATSFIQRSYADEIEEMRAFVRD